MLLRVYVGIDVQATLDGNLADENRPTIPTIEYVFTSVAPGKHTVEVRDIIGHSETTELVMPPLPDKSEGVLMGSVTIGPLCPVEPRPKPVGDVYASREVLLRQEKMEPIRLPLRSDGTFQAVIPAGRYIVEVTDCEFLGCQNALPVLIDIRDRETATLNIDIDTGIRSPVGGPTAYLQLSENLRATGASVEAGTSILQPFFSVPGRLLTVNESDVQVFEYPSLEEAERQAAQVAPDGSSVGTTMVTWVATPHFYHVGDTHRTLRRR